MRETDRRGLPTLDGERLAADGLSLVEVRARTAAGLTNRVPTGSSRSLLHILRANFFTLFNAVVGGSFALLLVLGQWQDAIFGLTVISNVLIGVVQEYRAKRTLDRLSLLHSPRALAIRGGEIAQIRAGDVVLDDVLVLGVGDQVAADATILAATGLEIDESPLTGEADPVAKSVRDEILSGSTVMAGRGTARVVRVGTESFANRLTTEAKRFSRVNSELRNAVNRILRWISWALIPLVALVVNGQMKAEGGWIEAITTGTWKQAAVGAIASTIGMIPQGLVLITSITFALAAAKLARRNVLVQELPAVEGLARVDVVCLDKTGTLTEGGVEFDALHATKDEDVVGVSRVLGWFASEEDANATARSMRQEFPATRGLDSLSTVPFASSRKWSAVSFGSGELSGSWVFGAAEMILTETVADDAAVQREVTALSSSGLRTLILAHAPRVMDSRDAALERLPAGLATVAIVTFRERVRSDAARTLAYFAEQKVALKVISGDSPHTVAAVAREVGLDFEGDGFDARDLPTNRAQMGEILDQHQVFGRVSPDQKKDMVAALQQRGHVVAMTGDGVNDVLALKQADIGIAMGSGADATKAVARIVLLDGEFSHLPGVVAEGRRAIANVELVSKLFLTKTSYAIVLALAFGGLLWDFPFLPRQLSAVDGLTIGIPALFLALLPNQRLYLAGFLRRTLGFSIPAGVVIGAVILAVEVYSRASIGHQEDEAQTAAALAVCLVGLWVLLVLVRPIDLSRALIVAGSFAGLVACLTVPLIRDFFDLTFPTGDLLVFVIGAATLGCIGIEIIWQARRISDRKKTVRDGGLG